MVAREKEDISQDSKLWVEASLKYPKITDGLPVACAYMRRETITCLIETKRKESVFSAAEASHLLKATQLAGRPFLHLESFLTGSVNHQAQKGYSRPHHPFALSPLTPVL